MPTYKLTYFDSKARGETARMLFKLAEQEFEDVRVEYASEQWAQMKDSMPMGQIPILEVDGVIICQSNAICRYLAKQFGYAGKTDLDQAKVDMILDSIEDVLYLAPFLTEKDESKKAELQKAYVQDTAEPRLEKLQELLESNNGGNGYFVGNEVTMADLTFVNMSHTMGLASNCPTLVDKYPKLTALIARVEALPKIAAWIKERPETLF